MQTVIKQFTISDKIPISDINSVLDDGKVWDETQGNKFLQDNNNIFLIAYYDKKPAGFLYGYMLQRFDKRKAEVLLYEIAVKKEFRKKGIGNNLITVLKSWAKDKGSSEIWVLLTNRSNKAGMALYQSAGGIIESDDEQMFTFKV